MKPYFNQSLLCSLIQYYKDGNYSTFKKICSLAYPETYNTDYFYTNLFLACNISGLIDVLNCEGNFRWSSSIYCEEEYIHIGTKPAKIIGTSQKWFEDHSHELVSLIEDQNKLPIIKGLLLSPDQPVNDRFQSVTSNVLGNYSKIEEMVCVKEDISFFNNKDKVEVFDLLNIKWEQVSIEEITKPSLYRVRKDLSGLHYYIYYPSLNANYKIKYPEWSHIVALRLLKWDFNLFSRLDNDTFIIDRRFQMPTLMLRYMFSNSRLLNIGMNLEFVNIKKEAFYNAFACINTSMGN